MTVDKSVLSQYSSLKVEVQDFRDSIVKLEQRIKRLETGKYSVLDSVKGTRPDGTYGSIRIAGIPIPYYDREQKLLQRRKDKLKLFELHLLELANQVHDYINGLDDSRLRRMLRYRYLDELSWVQVAYRMGNKYTADGCRKQVERFLQEK